MNSNRYIRQTVLSDFGPQAQKALSEARVLVVGLGGLGIPVLQYLNAMGVGTLGLIDQDLIELPNLQRQVLYTENDIGASKLAVALEKLSAQNSETFFISHDQFLVRENALDILKDYDVIVDATDNFATRYLINDACVILSKPFVYGALHGFEGQVAVFNYQGGPTYRCLFPTMPSVAEVPDCNTNGVLGVIPGIVGSLQALEVVKLITGVGEVLSGKLLLFNGLVQSFQKINFRTNPKNLKRRKLEETYESPDCETVPAISAEELKQILASGECVQLVDVRTQEEYLEFHLPGSVNIPLIELEKRIVEIKNEIPVYFLCQSGTRSELALKKVRARLRKASVYHVAGGINSYAILRS